MRRVLGIGSSLVVVLILVCSQAALAQARVVRTAVTSVRLGAPVHTLMQTDLKGRIAPGDPAANRTPGQGTVQACYDAPTGALCELSALADINAARAAEGVAPMILPSNFNSLNVPQQLLVLANLERVGRGLVPASGLANSLNQDAAVGAAANTDPNPSVVNGDVMASNWAGGTASTLLVDFLWMYDDGVGSENIDCVNAGDQGCWGHRDNILYPFDAPLAMGAAMVSGPSFGPSLAEVFVGGDYATGAGQADALLAPTWWTISASLRPSLSTTSLQLGRGGQSGQVQVRASGQPINVEASVTRGAGSWQVSPSSCQLDATGSCVLTVSRIPGSSGGKGTLTVSSPGGDSSVTLMSQASAKLSMHIPKKTVHKGHAATVRGHLSASDQAATAGQVVMLYARVVGSSVTTVVSQAQTTSSGSVTFRVAPRANTHYAIVFPGSATLSAAIAGPTEIRVR